MLELRLIKAKDLEWARKLRNRNKEYFFNTQRISYLQMLFWFQNLKDHFYIMWEGKQRVGTIAISKKNEVKNVIIDEKLRKKGYLAKALKLLEVEFGNPMTLEVKSDNPGAIKAYKKLGFEIYAHKMIRK